MVETRDFMRLFLEHRRTIYALILAGVPNAADADDILQEVSAAMWQKFSEFRADGNFAAWASGFVRYAVLNFYRSRRRRGKNLMLDDDVLETISQTFARQSPQWDVRQDALRVCVEKLPERSRLLIRLRYEAGVSLKEAADRIGRPVHSVSKSLSRIHEALVECVERVLRAEGRT